MLIKNALLEATKKLKTAKITSPHLDAEVILSFTLNKPKEYFYAHGDKTLTTIQFSKYKKLIAKRAKHYPVAYITNNKEFFGLNFYVDKNVLIPRPETELLVEQVLKIVNDNKQKTFTVAEIGTGSGCVAISIAKNSSARLLAVDVSPAALKIAKKNARLNKISKKIKFFHGDLLEPLKNKKLDIVAANLPYWYDDDMKNLLKSSWSKSIKHEPQLAIKGGKDGLAIYRSFFRQITKLKYLPKYILIETGNRQTERISLFIKKISPNCKTQTLKDLNNKNRLVIVRN